MTRQTYCPRCLQESDGVLIYCDRHLPEVEAEVRALYPPRRTPRQVVEELGTIAVLCALTFWLTACSVPQPKPNHWVQCPDEPMPKLIQEERLRDNPACHFV